MFLYTAYIFLVVLSYEVLTQQYEGDACIDSYTNSGRCVLLENCQSAIENFRKTGIRPSICQYTATSALVCCRDSSTVLPVQPSATQTRPSDRIGSNRRAGLVSIRKCRQYSNDVIETVAFISLVPDPEALTITAPKCDYTSTELIVGGENAKQGEFPHMAAIGWENFEGGYSFDCGGTLISSRFVLTAGHCTQSPKFSSRFPAIVRLGDQNLDPSVNDNAHPIEVPIKNVIKHPNYKSPRHYDDIALFELVNDVKFNNYIRPACLWTEPNFRNHAKALATGWGVTNSATNQISNELQKVSLNILDNSFCNSSLNQVINRNWDHGFESNQMCAGDLSEKKDTCQGDSGSPLQIVLDDNQCIFYVIGITSFGPNICGARQPAVYTRVYSYLGWIESIVWPNE